MTILGVDPGTAKTGFGVIKKTKAGLSCLDFGVITTGPKQTREKRLQILYNQLLKLLKKHSPDIMVVENLFFFKNLKTVMPVAEAKGVILLAGAKKKVEIAQLSPLQVKMGICNYGRADKKQVQKMIKEILGLDKIPKPDDAADGLALAVCWAQCAPKTKK